LTNCSFAGNAAQFAGGIYISINYKVLTTTIDNCVLWDNTQTGAGTTQDAQIIEIGLSLLAISSSSIQGWTGALGGIANAALDPLFPSAKGPDGVYGTSDDSLALGPGSDCIDSGNNTLVPPDSFDLDGDANSSEPTPIDLISRARFQDDPVTPDTGVGLSPVVDRGAYEYVDPPRAPLPCYANCDWSSGEPALTANDFLCFVNAYAAGLSYANCDGSTGVPSLTGNDFLCFINAYATGCP